MMTGAENLFVFHIHKIKQKTVFDWEASPVALTEYQTLEKSCTVFSFTQAN